MTDALSSFYRGNCTVVRFNGGAQAGHTVVTPEGKRHIFSHFGAGTYAGASTYLSKHFIVNPLLMMREYAELESDLKIPIMVSGSAPVTTPYDMMINHLFEKRRGFKSSCGVGINETYTRHQSQYPLKLSDLWSGSAAVRGRLDQIKHYWVPWRLKNIGIESITSKEDKDLFQNSGVIDQFLEDCKKLITLVRTCNFSKEDFALKGNLIFEGAQGLALDQTHGQFPYVTRSNTGLDNVLDILRPLDDNEDINVDTSMEVIYVTRGYATRHGAGPLPNETQHLPYPGINETTNVKNEYQGSFRYGYLDLNTLANFITNDFKKARMFKADMTVAVTCLDQVSGSVTFSNDGDLHSTSVDKFLDIVQAKTGATKIITSHGPTRATLANFQMAYH